MVLLDEHLKIVSIRSPVFVEIPKIFGTDLKYPPVLFIPTISLSKDTIAGGIFSIFGKGKNKMQPEQKLV